MGSGYPLQNYEVNVGGKVFMVTKGTALLIKKATYECKTKYSGFCFDLGECFSVSCWLEEYWRLNLNPLGHVVGIEKKDQEIFKQIVASLKTVKGMDIHKYPIRKKRDRITYHDLRIEQGVDAEQVLEDKYLTQIFRDYLTDDGLRDEVIKRVQEILDLISKHLVFRKGERERLEEKRGEHRKECQKKINQSYQNYLENCRNYSA